MNIIFISEGVGKALKTSRRILDRYAVRIGQDAWEASLSEEGLETVHSLLRRAASPRISVCCHRLRYQGLRQLVWIVGKRQQYVLNGQCATGSTTRAVIRNDVVRTPAHQVVSLLVIMAGLSHDLGKAFQAFQEALFERRLEAFRHELVSYWIIEGVIRKACGGQMPKNEDDNVWLDAMCSESEAGSPLEALFTSVIADLAQKEKAETLTRPVYLEPFQPGGCPPILASLLWLILSHHRQPSGGDGSSDRAPRVPTLKIYCRVEIEKGSPATGGRKFGESPRRKPLPASKSFLPMRNELPWKDAAWLAKLRQTLRRLQAVIKTLPEAHGHDWLDYAGIFGRLALQAADHAISADKKPDPKHDAQAAYANPSLTNGGAQRLPAHLVNVGGLAGVATWTLPELRRLLPGVAKDSIPARLQRKSQDQRFSWQDEAAKAVAKAAPDGPHGFFGVLLAETGQGKTVGAFKVLARSTTNLRVLYASPMRMLTLQAGRSLASELGFQQDQLGTLIGDTLIQNLFSLAEKGSEDEAEQPKDDEPQIDGGSVPEGFDHPLFRIQTERERRLLCTPVLAITLDTIMKLADARRGGHVLQAIRVASSDLVIDEIDMYSAEDLVAIGRLLRFAGFWRCRLMLSSATLSAQIASGLFSAYRSGHELRNRIDGESKVPLVVAWMHNRSPAKTAIVPSNNAFDRHHDAYVAAIAREPRIGLWMAGPPADCKGKAFDKLSPAILRIGQLHLANHFSYAGKRVSVGCIHVVNVADCQQIAIELAEGRRFSTDMAGYRKKDSTGITYRVVCTHGRLNLLTRNFMETKLNAMLNRKSVNGGDSAPVLNCAQFRAVVATSATSDVVLIVVSTSESTGRDHDYDWGILEARDRRIVEQFQGRIRRHRPPRSDVVNLCLLSAPLRGDQAGNPLFDRYGVNDPVNGRSARRLFTARSLGEDPSFCFLQQDSFEPASRLLPSPLVREVTRVDTKVQFKEIHQAEQARHWLVLLDDKEGLARWLSSSSLYRALQDHAEQFRFRRQGPSELVVWQASDSVQWQVSNEEGTSEQRWENIDDGRVLPPDNHWLFGDFEVETQIALLEAAGFDTSGNGRRRLTGMRIRNQHDKYRHHLMVGLMKIERSQQTSETAESLRP